MTVEIEGYRDLEVIGQGGFAVVYKARQVSVGRDVAIKLLTDVAPDADLVRRFERESKAVGALSWHPHIAAVVDAGTTAQAQAYIVFELLTGGSLEDRLASGPLSWPDAVAAMIQVSDAVEAAHRADVLHRDIKPANILLNRIGVAKLGDFGIASMQDGTKTATGTLATTVAHAAPELFDGGISSRSTDVYALASTLHNLVAGHPPFVPPTGERISTIIGKILSAPPPQLDPVQVPHQIATVIAHALAKQPQYRPRSAAAFGQALQQAQRELGIAVTPMPVSDNEPDPAAAVAPPQQVAPPQAVFTPAPVAFPPVASLPAAASPIVVGLVESPLLAAPSERKPLSRSIAVLSAVAVLLAAAVAGLVLYDQMSSTTPLATTQGGATILTVDALDDTEMAPPFDAMAAIDQDLNTAWGVVSVPGGASIVGTSYVIKLTEEQNVRRVGIVANNDPTLGQVDALIWGTALVDGALSGTVVRHDFGGDSQAQLIDFPARTDRIILVIASTEAPDAVNAGIAEILIEVGP